MKKNLPKISIVVLNYNGSHETIECLTSLRGIQIKNYVLEIIVVDNGSTDNSLEKIEKSNSFQGATLIRLKENFGFAEGNNVGIRHALKYGADYIFLLNNDTVIDQNLLPPLLHQLQAHKLIGIIGPKIYFAKGFEYHYSRYQEKDRGKVIWFSGGIIDWKNMLFSHRGVNEIDSGQFNKSESTDFISGCAMLIRRDVIEKIGMFDPRYYLYLEDVDLCERAKRVGFKLWYEPKAYLWHKNASSSGKPGSAIHVYYQTRNRLLFGLKYGSIRTKFALLRESIKMLTTDNVRRQAVLDFYCRRFGKSNIKK